jgi:hypothetical protein
MDKLKKIYSKIYKLEHDILLLFNEEVGGRGVTGLCSTDDFGIAIDYLESAKNMLIRINKERLNNGR